METLAEMIEEFKIKSGMTDGEIGIQAGVSKLTIFRIRHGDKACPLTLGGLCRVMGTPYRKLVEANDKQSQQDTKL